MTSAPLIPDRRRTHFPINGGLRPTKDECQSGHDGIEKAREVLEATSPLAPTQHDIAVQLTPVEINRARAGITQARKALDEND